MRTLTVERPWFPYPRGPFPYDGACRLRLYTEPGWRPVLVMSDLGDRNPGASVENAVEQAAATAWAELLPDEATPPVCITHFPPGRLGPATFTLATFDRWHRHERHVRLDRVRWIPLTVTDLAALIGPEAAAQLADWQQPASA